MNVSPKQMRRACEQAKELFIQQSPVYAPLIAPALASIQQWPVFLTSGVVGWFCAQKISPEVAQLKDVWDRMNGFNKAALTVATFAFLYADETPLTSILLAAGSGTVIGHILGKYPVFVRV